MLVIIPGKTPHRVLPGNPFFFNPWITRDNLGYHIFNVLMWIERDVSIFLDILGYAGF